MGAVAALWDRIPVKGAMVGVVGALGAVLVLLLAPGGSTCQDSGGLRHVYHPQRLHVLAECQTVTFQVVAWRLEHDGDYHVNGIVQGSTSWINAANARDQHGLTVFEFVPGDPRPPKFYAGELLKVLTTKVLDAGHASWIEGHPIFNVNVVGGSRIASGDPVGLAPPTEGER